jgi:hypothetical protein
VPERARDLLDLGQEARDLANFTLDLSQHGLLASSPMSDCDRYTDAINQCID